MSVDRPESPDSPRPLGEISQAPAAFEQFLDRNQKGLVLFAILLALAAAGFVVYQGIERSKEESAGGALQAAEDLPALQGVLKEYPDTAAAGSAKVLLAAEQWEQGQQDAAITTLRELLSSYPDHPARHTARASLGSKLMAQGKSAEAKEVFDDLIKDPQAQFLAPYALISLGDIARAEGDPERAEKLYLQSRTDYPANQFSETASRRLVALKAKLPTEIDPPPAPEPGSVPPSAPNSLTPTPPPFLRPPTLTPPPSDESVAPPGEATPNEEVVPADEATPADEVAPADDATPVETPEDAAVEDAPGEESDSEAPQSEESPQPTETEATQDSDS